VKRSETKPEGSVEQRREPMDKNWIGGLRCRASEPLTAKLIAIKDTGGKSGGGAWKAIELTSGDLLHVMES
jgi:hypothetical protein